MYGNTACLQQLYRNITAPNAAAHGLPTREISHPSLAAAPCQISINQAQRSMCFAARFHVSTGTYEMAAPW
ncbi:hypothetical protein V8C42DRAFT_315837 [Trichoderma barbatum]